MEDMYICLCNGVRQSEIEKAIKEDGIVTLNGLKDTLEVAINCGTCQREVLGLLTKHRPAQDDAEEV